MIHPPTAIRARAEDVVAGVLGDKIGFSRMVKRMIAHTIKEYRGRFLHELIQNGYDAHPEGSTGGQIAIHFHDAEGDHGVLYVANGGRPLSNSNFERMASLGESDKAVGVGIGNKGVGFKSVFQICGVPEVYSALDDRDPSYDGYSFRFGTHADLVTMLDGNEARADEVAKKLSLSMLTMALDTVPEFVQAFRAQGYVTVLRLPALSARAGKEIKERIDRLLNPTTPITLFLERIETLSVQATSADEPTVMTRRTVETEEGFVRVVLDETEAFRLFQAAVPAPLLHEALQDSVEEGALDERWLEWDEPAYVSVAVGDGYCINDGHAFTYLPMGDGARSPLAGHINAPFVTDFARVGLDREQPVNRLLFSSIAELCLKSAAQIVAHDGDADTLVDLVAWSEAVEALEDGCSRAYDEDLADFVKLPTLRGPWTSLSQARLWSWPEASVINIAALTSNTAAALVNPDRLDKGRRSAVAYLADVLETSILPSPAELAEWSVSLAAALVAASTPVERWADFYDDLSALFSDGQALAGQPILLSADGTLAPCNEPLQTEGSGSRRRRRRSVFFSPQTGSDRDTPDDASDDTLVVINAQGTATSAIDLRPPRSLRERIVFMHPDLAWYQGQNRRPGREFLETARLVQAFRTDRLLPLLGQVMETITSDASKRDALGFAFRLFAGDSDRHARELASVGLQVPTQSGKWILASRARFGRPWPVPGASDLSAVAGASSPDTPELMGLKTLLVAGPTTFADISGVDDHDRWRSFLTVLGVSTTLPVASVADRRGINGRYLTAERLTGRDMPEAVPVGVVTQWRAGIGDTANMSHPDTRFTTNDDLYWLLGQHEAELLPKHQRSLYAQLVVRTLPSLSDAHLFSTWRRSTKGGYETRVPTPIRTFLRTQPWVPNGRYREDPDFRVPSESWYVAVEDTMAANYSPLITSPVRQAIDNVPNSRKVIDQIGLQIWGDREDAAALIDHLTEIFESGELSETSADHFRSALSHAWLQIGDTTLDQRPLVERGLLVERAGRIELLPASTAGAERLFLVSINDPSATTRLVRELGWPVLSVETDDPDSLREIASAVLRPHWHDNVEVAADWDVEVLADGEAWTSSESAERLCAEVGWLPLLVACSMRFPRSGARVGKSLESTIDELGRIRLVRSDAIQIATINGQDPLPARLRGVLPIAGSPPTLLVEKMDTPLTWRQLETVAEAALELLGQTRFTAELSLNIGKLASGRDSAIFRPDHADIAEVLGVPTLRVAETESHVYGSMVGLLTRLLPSAVCRWGPDVLGTLSTSALTTREDLVAVLATLHGGDAVQTEVLLQQAADSVDADDLRRRLAIDLVDFNQVLRDHFPSARIVDNSGAQLEEYLVRRSQRRAEILDWMRELRLPRFLSGDLQRDWPEMRALQFLQPDPEWATTHDDLGEPLIDASIDAELTTQFGARPTVLTLAATSDVREANGRPMRVRLEAFDRLIAAWKRKADPEAPPGPDEVGDAYVGAAFLALDQVGALDFVPLTDEALIAWLSRVAMWPHTMPRTDDLEALGLTNADLTGAATDQERAREAKIRADRQLSLHGKVIDLDATMTNLVAMVSANLDSAPSSLDTPYRSASLQVLKPSSPKRRGRPTGSVNRQPLNRLSDPQRQATGLAGEMTAFHWLKSKDRSPVDETCWKSTNVSFVFEGALGDDSLGYDFEVPRRGGSVMYEVKATSSDAGMIELGETEVVCAQEFARTSRWRLLIVEDALSLEPRVWMLPNPFSRDSRARFRFVGNSVRLRFQL